MKVGRRQAFEVIDRVLANAGVEELSENLQILHKALIVELMERPIQFFKSIVVPLCSDSKEVDIYDKEVWDALTPGEQAEAMNEMTSDYERYRADKLAAENKAVVHAPAATAGVAQPA